MKLMEDLKRLCEDSRERFVGEVEPTPGAVLEALGGAATSVSRAVVQGEHNVFVVTGRNRRQAVVQQNASGRYTSVRVFEPTVRSL